MEEKNDHHSLIIEKTKSEKPNRSLTPSPKGGPKIMREKGGKSKVSRNLRGIRVGEGVLGGKIK